MTRSPREIAYFISWGEPCDDVDPMPDYKNVLIDRTNPVRRIKRRRLRPPVGCAPNGN